MPAPSVRGFPLGMFASWVHGNALVIEGDPLEYFEATEPTKRVVEDPLSSSGGWRYEIGEASVSEVRPRLVVNHLGWGTVVELKPGTIQWFHIPLPTPVIHEGNRLQLVRFFLLWMIEGEALLDLVHLYDGWQKLVTAFNGIDQYGPEGLLKFGPGDHRKIDAQSKFELSQPRLCETGFGISFRVNCTGNAVLTVSAAGADFEPLAPLHNDLSNNANSNLGP